MSITLWRRATAAAREQYERSILGRYGAGLHAGCDDCEPGPHADVALPAPRAESDSVTRTRDGASAG